MSQRTCNSFLFSSFVSTSTFCHSPFGFAGADKASLMYMREAEIKHSRLAMLAGAFSRPSIRSADPI